MAASPFDKKKFGEYVRIHAVDGMIITREDEAKLLREGIAQFGLELAEARGIIHGITVDHDISLASHVEAQVGAFLDFSVKKNRIGRKIFNDAVAMYKQATKGMIPDIDIRKRLKEIVLLRGWRARKSHWLIGSRRWFRRI